MPKRNEVSMELPDKAAIYFPTQKGWYNSHSMKLASPTPSFFATIGEAMEYRDNQIDYHMEYSDTFGKVPLRAWKEAKVIRVAMTCTEAA